MERVSPRFPFFTTVLLFIYSVVPAHVLVFGFIYLLFFAELVAANFILAADIIASCLLIAGVLISLKRFVDHLHKKYGIVELKRYRNLLLIGFGGISLCSIIPRIAVYFVVEIDAYVQFFSIIVLNATAIIFYFAFIFGLRDLCVLDYKNRKVISLIAISVFVHFIALAVTIRIANCYENRVQGRQIFHCQALFLLICASSTIEFLIVLSGEVKLAKQEPDIGFFEMGFKKGTNKKESSEDKKTGLQCVNCMKEYSVDVDPRIAKECEYTLCKKCADDFSTIFRTAFSNVHFPDFSSWTSHTNFKGFPFPPPK